MRLKGLYFSFLAAAVLTAMPCFAQNGKDIPVSGNTSLIAEAEPFYKEVTISGKDKSALDKIKQTDLKILELKQKLNSAYLKQYDKETQSKFAAQSSTKVSKPVIAEKYTRQSNALNKKLSQSKNQAELAQQENIKKEIAALKAEKNKLIAANPQLSRQAQKLSAQQEINYSYTLYFQARRNKMTDSARADMPDYKDLPEYKLPPSQLQKIIAEELALINSKIKQGQAYKSYAALEREIQKLNKNKRDDFILMSVFTLVTLRNFNGVRIAAPSSALKWWSLKKIAFYTKKTLNFIGVLTAYTLIDEANINAIGASWEEQITRFVYLQNNYSFLNRLISDGQKSVFSEKNFKIPASWGQDEVKHQNILRQLYGLKFINTYLAKSTVSYKYDLAMLDLFNLFSDKQKVFFDFSVFNTKKGYEGDKLPPSERKKLFSGMKYNGTGFGGTGSLLDRTDELINSLKALPKHLYYKKVYYKALPDNQESLAEIYFLLGGKAKADKVTERENGLIFFPVPPQNIIRTQEGKLQDCSQYKTHRSSGETRGKDMEFFDGGYYMRIEPAANDNGTFYRAKPKTYVFEDINTNTKRCGSQINTEFA